MTTERHGTHGIDRAQLAEFAEHAAENPEAVQFELGARASYEGTCAHSLGKIDQYTLGGDTIDRETREYTIPYGGWKEVLEAGGWIAPTDRPEPIEVALSALAACLNVGISLNAVANGVDFDELKTTVSAEFDPAVLFSLAELRASDSVFDNVTADIEIEGDDVDKDMIDEWARRAPVYTLISQPQDIELTVEAPQEITAGD